MRSDGSQCQIGKYSEPEPVRWRYMTKYGRNVSEIPMWRIKVRERGRKVEGEESLSGIGLSFMAPSHAAMFCFDFSSNGCKT